jgi:hypothetical protein
MGVINCDDCGEQPYVAPLTGDYSNYYDFEDDDPDVEIWCECPEDRAVELSGRNVRAGQPDCWGQSGGRFVCYECGEIPRMISTTDGGGLHSPKNYRLTCRCMTFGVYFRWCDVMPDAWKSDMDTTKWEDLEDEIEEIVDEYGPTDRDEITEHIDLSDAGVQCHVIRMCREDRLSRDDEQQLIVPSQSGNGSQDNDTDETCDVEETSDPEETGLRSGKGSGFFSRLLGLGGDD